MIISGALLLERYKEEINALNVFPVPDGDTGTNMSFTMKGAVSQIDQAEINGIDVMGEALSRGALKGARGNSGVILSQIFRGFYQGMKGKITINSLELGHALQGGVETAYKAVMKPREGTILTVARAFADAALKKAEEGTEDLIEVMEAGMAYGKEILAKTPDMLDVLKKAGVVDAGGEGLLLIYQGFISAMKGEEPVGDLSELAGDGKTQLYEPIIDDLDEITFGYCTEFFIINLFDNVTLEDIDALKTKISKLGDSIVVVGDTDLVKIHVHTDMPGKVLQYALNLGALDKIKIDNMREQNKDVLARKKNEPKKKNGVVAVTAGDGMAAIFKDLGVDYVVEGGQTMNPSTEDIAKAVEKVHAEHVYILPNNSNIIMAAQQSADIVECKVHVITSKTSPQGIAAMLAYDPDSDSDMTEDMNASLQDVITGQITYAVRDSSYDDMDIKEGDIMGMIDGKISVVGKKVSKVAEELIEKMSALNEDAEIITIFRGEDTKEKEAETLLASVKKKYPEHEVDLQTGGQPLYYYIISVE
ncbi:MAG: DAK2 domain-containing protein [Clostridia bacterium]|nr:DAK2 domain-containing protein [Clostridia bacterium]